MMKQLFSYDYLVFPVVAILFRPFHRRLFRPLRYLIRLPHMVVLIRKSNSFITVAFD